MRRTDRVAISAGAVLTAGICTAAVASAVRRGRSTADRGPAGLGEDFTVRQATIGDNVINYAEGPDNGPVLLLIPGQVSEWDNYRKVMPALAEEFRVVAVDVYGHGGSTHDPAMYKTTLIGTDLCALVELMDAGPVYVSGHSSGGLIATWMAANRPDLVRGLVIEDAPFFSSELPKARKTVNYRDLSISCHRFLQSQAKDFPTYYVPRSYTMKYLGPVGTLLSNHVAMQRRNNPDRPLRVPFVPAGINEYLRTLHTYDPHFGEAFYTGSFHEGTSHEKMLRSVQMPSVLIHTLWFYDPSGVLMGAMDDNDANLARELLKTERFYKVKTGHAFHFDRPEEFAAILVDFKERVEG